VTIDTPSAATLPALGGPGFPASAYPAAAPLKGAGTALTACPSMQGVVPFTRAAVATARQLLGYWNTGYSYDLHASDRDWWPALLSGFIAEGGRQTVGLATPASDSLYADALDAACGRSLVKDSIQVVLGPSPYNFSYQHVFLLDRGGSPLVYFATI
jgi:hypothetical protein